MTNDKLYYYDGDLCRYSGNSRTLYGKVCYEYIKIEGHKVGESRWSYDAPDAIGHAVEPQRA